MSVIAPKILPKSTNERERELNTVLDNLIIELRKIINGGIQISENLNVKLVSYTSNATPDTETVCPHTLGKTPAGYIIYGQDIAGNLYTSTGGTAWTSTNIYLKCTVASVTFKLIIF